MKCHSAGLCERVTYLSGRGVNRHYELGLLGGLSDLHIEMDVIGTTIIGDAPLLKSENIRYYDFFGDRSADASIARKILRVISFYVKLIAYIPKSESRLFHLQWTNKFVIFDRTLLLLYYKLFGKKVIFTAHNVNTEERDGRNGSVNKLSLGFMYRHLDHIIVHTQKMREQILAEFNVEQQRVSVIPHGLMDSVVDHGLTAKVARARLGIPEASKVVLFFGNIVQYKGIEDLLGAFAILRKTAPGIHLVIAGAVKSEARQYWKRMDACLDAMGRERIHTFTQFIPDEQVQYFFQAADVLALPYRKIYQSGVLFLAYHYGLPVVVTDVGSLAESVREGKTGYVGPSCDPSGYAATIESFFNDPSFSDLEAVRERIRSYAREKYSWLKIAQQTAKVYAQVLEVIGPRDSAAQPLQQ